MASSGSIWGDILGGLKRFFTNPVVVKVESIALPLVATLWPGIGTVIGGLLASIGKAESLAAAAGVQSGTGPQKLALAVQDAQSIFKAYEVQTGKVLESDKQAAAISKLCEVLDLFN